MFICQPHRADCIGRSTFLGKGILALLLLAVLALSCYVLLSDSDTSSADPPTSGTCGENLSWEYNTTTHTLTIMGTGDMANYNQYSSFAPWYNDYRGDIQTVNVGDGVTSIGSCAFRNCSQLSTIDLPNTLISIQGTAFSGCYGLNSITIPNSVTTIYSDSFYGCKHLYSLTLGSSVETIYSSAFRNCIHLVEIFNLSGLQLQKASDDYGSIARYAMKISSSVGPSEVRTQGEFVYMEMNDQIYLIGSNNDDASLVLPDKIDGHYYRIKDSAFYQYTAITSISFGSGVTTIEANAFYGCTGLTSLTIPGSVDTIGTQAFGSCSNVTTASLGDGVLNIGDGAFRVCSKLTEFTIPASVVSIGENVFSACSLLESISVDGSNQNYSSDAGVLFDKDKTVLIKYPVKKAGSSYPIPATVVTVSSYAFQSCSSLASIEIPNSVTAIGDNAFSGCSGLVSIDIGTGLSSIGAGAFNSCNSLQSLFVDPNNTHYCTEGNVLYDKGKTVVIKYPAQKTDASYSAPGTLVTITDYAFYGNTSLTSVTLTNSVTSIGEHAFQGCSNLASVTGTTGVKTIGTSAFEGAAKLESISLQSVETIGSRGFFNCSLLANVDLSSVKSVGNSAFYECIGIEEANMPSATLIDSHAFNGCTSLATVTFGNKLATLGQYVFSGCNSITAIVIPDSVDLLNFSVFQGCSSLANVHIGNGVKEVRGNAFWNCAITTIYIGYGLEKVDNDITPAFRGMIFYDTDGTTPLMHTPENLKGGLFETVGGKLVLQSRTSPPANSDGGAEFPVVTVAIGAVAVLAALGAAVFFVMKKKA